ncbi:MAG: tetratricopeptide repeat protein [Bacteroidia bacterium]
MKKHNEIFENFKTHLLSLPSDQKRVEEIVEFSIVYGDSYGEKIAPLMEEGMKLAQKINYRTGETLCYYNLLFFQGRTQGGAAMSDDRYAQDNLLEMVEKIKDDTHWYSLGLNLLAYYYWFKGDYEKGFNLAFDGVKSGEKLQDKNLGWHYFALGVFYFDTKDPENSELYYQKAVDVFLQFDYAYGKARASNGLASVAIYKKEVEKAVPLLEFASGIYRDFGHYSGLSRAVNDMALIEKEAKNYPKAIELFKESIELRKEINHAQGLITSLTELGEIYLDIGNFEKANEYLTAALDYAIKARSKQKIMRLHKLFYDAYKKINKTELALHHFEQFYELKTQLLGDEANNNIRRLQSNFEKEKSEKEAEFERLKNAELKEAYNIIEQKNKDIHDSIIYASRIQRSLLPQENYFLKNLKRLK